MVLRMTISYECQVAKVNEKSPLESSLDLTLRQHPCDEDPESQEVRPCLEVEPLRTWYNHISLKFHTLVILLQINPIFCDEPEIICEGCYEIEDTFVFAWSSILGVKHYCWLHGPIHQLPPNSKADYLVHTIQHILDFLQL